MLLGANDDWLLQDRCMGVEALDEFVSPSATDATPWLPRKAA